MVARDAPDFAQLTTTVAALAPLTAGVVGLVPGGVAFVNLDTSSAATVLLHLPGPTGPGSNKYTLRFDATTNGVVVDTQTLSMHPAGAYSTNVSTLTVRIPAKGDAMVVTAQGSTADPIDFAAWGTSTPETSMVIERDGDTYPALVADISAGVLAAGATAGPFPIPPCTRAVALRSINSATQLQYTLRAVVFTGAAVVTKDLWGGANTGVLTSFSEILAPRLGLELSIKNTDAAGHTADAQVWDVS